MSKSTKQFIWTLLPLLVGFTACQQAADSGAEVSETATTYSRIISLSGAITETLFALGQGDKVVGIDVTSTYPETTAELPQLGHVSKLNAEALLALQPDLIIAEAKDQAIPQLGQLQQSGIEILFVENSYTLDGPIQMAERLAKVLGQDDKLTFVKKDLEQQRQQLAQIKEQSNSNPKVLFIYALGKGSLMVAGTGTPAAAMIDIAGGQNAVTEFEGFKALTPEGLIAAQPEIILLFESGLQSLGGPEGLIQVPGLAQTPAGANQRFIAMDGLYLLGFTPRAGQAAVELAQKIQLSFQNEL